ncbi:ATP-binding protein [Heyndrickxia ginsengihumi]|uniref:ATP-binding protein n=1 Tax=Heyndrickxia ginsengihumi TaxID=363870 RepID=UPI003D25EBA5
MFEPTSIFGQVIFNLLIVLTPIFFYQLIFSKFNNNRLTQIISGIIFGCASILSMAFPVVSSNFGNGFLWDLRWIPFVICVLYMGYVPGAVSAILLVAFRFFLGGMTASINTLFDAIILFILFSILRKKYHQFKMINKYLMNIVFSVITFSVICISLWIYFSYLHKLASFYSLGFDLFFQMGLSYLVGIMVFTYFTENMINRIKIMEQIHRAEKLNIVSELAASIAHEVRNPLTVVRGFIQLAKNEVDNTIQGYMNTAIRELDRAEKIISDYLNFAKPKLDVKKEEVNISCSINEMILLMQSYANLKGIQLNNHIDQNLFIEADDLKFKQVLLNLIKNAIEATEQGHVDVDASYSEKKGHIIVNVTDTGMGMTKEQLQKLGKPYYTTKSEGTGLGLMVTFRLIEAIGGTLTFDSKLNQGTKATICIKGYKKEATNIHYLDNDSIA